jgi:hypothetical protein
MSHSSSKAIFPSIERGGDVSFVHTSLHFHLCMEIFRSEFPCIDGNVAGKFAKEPAGFEP